eukprot:CAMPEP_0171053048 /NCGR_PEP_ID=MMETSP0736-20130129/54231_1 /TAXON_ID=186038 /ORGANISM="Fragilariopsis kerguelensis, Strain L26-C5" /LENGTH=51 /DNA_ID=CAMNT_0011506871 /DNA_START=1107 /DNA_END=1258 /DNA_ORIENTATION=-
MTPFVGNPNYSQTDASEYQTTDGSSCYGCTNRRGIVDSSMIRMRNRRHMRT